MAIQVSGTTVIDDSRNLVNVIGLKTINSTSILGSGDIAAGASTTAGAVATYLMATVKSTALTTYDYGATIAGSNLWGTSIFINATTALKSTYSFSGTWRCMGYIASNSASSGGSTSIFVRIS
tara:strand:+ start:31 stop:399 length:369 start_codon:yes stop_codon:yes gene_type:complete